MNPILTIAIHLKGREYQSIIKTIFRYLQVKLWKYFNKTVEVSIRDCENINIVMHPGCAVSEKLYVVGLYDPALMITMKKILKSDDVFYDVGANIGPFSLLAHHCGSAVFAFEGHPDTAKRCKENFLKNGINAERVIAGVVSDHDGTVSFSNMPGSSINRVMEKSCPAAMKTLIVPSVSLDKFALTHARPTVVKIDTEGHELHVINGMKSLLKDIKYITFEANGLSSQEDLLKIKEILTNAGFLIGHIDWVRNVFIKKNDLGHKSPTGDYIAINKSYISLFEHRGIRIVDQS